MILIKNRYLPSLSLNNKNNKNIKTLLIYTLSPSPNFIAFEGRDVEEEI